MRQQLCGRATPKAVRSLKISLPILVEIIHSMMTDEQRKAIQSSVEYWWIAMSQLTTPHSVRNLGWNEVMWVKPPTTTPEHLLEPALNLKSRCMKATRRAKVIVQMMRSQDPSMSDPFVRQVAEHAYWHVRRMASLDATIAARDAGGVFVLSYLLTKHSDVVYRWVRHVFSKQGGDGRGGGRPGPQKDWEIVDGPEGGKEPAKVISNEYNPDAGEKLPSGIPQNRGAPKPDSGRWNLLGDAIVESARASRRAFRRRDCDTGNLDPRKFAEVGVGLNLDRAFIQTRSARSRKVAVEILIDVSGSVTNESVGGEKIITTEASMAQAFSEAFRKAQVDCKIYAFNDDCFVAKNYHQRRVDWSNLWGGHGTQMGTAMGVSRKSLMSKNADRKIMIVLSDGDEGCGASQQAALARQSRIEVYGFFIGCHPPSGASQSFTGTFGNLTPKACVSEVCGAVRRSLENQNQNR